MAKETSCQVNKKFVAQAKPDELSGQNSVEKQQQKQHNKHNPVYWQKSKQSSNLVLALSSASCGLMGNEELSLVATHTKEGLYKILNL